MMTWKMPPLEQILREGGYEDEWGNFQAHQFTRAQSAKKARASRTPEMLLKNLAKARAAITPEMSLKNLAKARAAVTPEMLLKNLAKARAAVTPEMLLKNLAKAHAAITPEMQRKEKTMYSNNTSGHKGICWHSRVKKWCAYIVVNRRKIALGYFTRLEDAVAARKAAELKYWKKETY